MSTSDPLTKNQEKLSQGSDELEFLPAVLEVTETPPSPLGRGMILAIAALFTIALLMSIFGKIDVIATAQGKIIPSQQVKVVQAPEQGVVTRIHVDDGSVVKAGSPLLDLDPTQSDAEIDRLHTERLAIRLDVARHLALLEDNPNTTYLPPDDAPASLIAIQRQLLKHQWSSQTARVESLQQQLASHTSEKLAVEADIKRIELVFPKLKERVNQSDKLLSQGYTSRFEHLELEQQLIDMRESINVQVHKRAEVQASIRSLSAQMDELKSQFQQEQVEALANAQRELANIEQELRKVRQKQGFTTLTAPVDGTVQQLAVHTVGGVVSPAQELLVVVPASSKLEVDAMVMNKDIGFIHHEQNAEIKVESFTFTRYGTIPGKLKTISRNAVQDEAMGLVFPVRVEMAKESLDVDGQEVPLGPGMAVTVEIKTGQRRVIEYLLGPLSEYSQESWRER